MLTLSTASANKKLMSCDVSSIDLWTRPIVWRCFGFAIDKAIASPTASWNAEKGIDFIYVAFIYDEKRKELMIKTSKKI